MPRQVLWLFPLYQIQLLLLLLRWSPPLLLLCSFRMEWVWLRSHKYKIFNIGNNAASTALLCHTLKLSVSRWIRIIKLVCGWAVQFSIWKWQANKVKSDSLDCRLTRTRMFIHRNVCSIDCFTEWRRQWWNSHLMGLLLNSICCTTFDWFRHSADHNTTISLSFVCLLWVILRNRRPDHPCQHKTAINCCRWRFMTNKSLIFVTHGAVSLPLKLIERLYLQGSNLLNSTEFNLFGRRGGASNRQRIQ